MFDIGGTELLLIAVVALVVIGPKDLPNALRVVGRYTGKARAMTRHLRSGFDEMMRQAELEEMEKQWAEQNRRIMEATPDAGSGATDTAPAADVQQAPEIAPPETATPETEPPEIVPPESRPLP